MRSVRLNVETAGSVVHWMFCMIVLDLINLFIINTGCAASTVYIGCYRDGVGNRAMQSAGQPSSSMTLDLCRQRCLDSTTYTYLGTEEGKECYCDDRYAHHGPRSARACVKPCRGNRNQICGGAGALSVHTVCPIGYYGQRCTERCRCGNNAVCFRGNGACTTGGCAPGSPDPSCSQDIDVDECTTGSHTCETDPDVGSCVNTQGSYRCECRQGYTLRADGKCEDKNECLSRETHHCAQNCLNTRGSYTCSCTSGYELQSDLRSCQDINECFSNKGGCSHDCINTDGSYTCRCGAGYSLSPNRHDCQDVNECSRTSLNQCDRNQGVCTNLPGGYECGCTEGYQLRDQSLVRPRPDVISVCEDKDECLSSNTHLCAQNCLNTRGSYTCSCTSGYELQSDLRSCQDINECFSNNGGCAHNCINTDGSYTCRCRAGYTLSPNRHDCHDVDECFNSLPNQCDRDQGVCTNLPGGYECGCTEGYQLRDQSLISPRPDVTSHCEDIDECAPEKRDETCEENQNCTNTRGAFICHCNDRYYQANENGPCVDSADSRVTETGSDQSLMIYILCGIIGVLVVAFCVYILWRTLRGRRRENDSQASRQQIPTPSPRPNGAYFKNKSNDPGPGINQVPPIYESQYDSLSYYTDNGTAQDARAHHGYLELMSQYQELPDTYLNQYEQIQRNDR